MAKTKKRKILKWRSKRANHGKRPNRGTGKKRFG